MVTTKWCACGTCIDNSQYPQSWKRNSNGDPVKFFHFPGAVRRNKRRQRWITACHRGDSFVGAKDSYICSIHFVGGNGSTNKYPDPISAVASKEKVSLSVFLFIILFVILKYFMPCIGYAAQLQTKGIRWTGTQTKREARKYINLYLN